MALKKLLKKSKENSPKKKGEKKYDFYFGSSEKSLLKFFV